MPQVLTDSTVIFHSGSQTLLSTASSRDNVLSRDAVRIGLSKSNPSDHYGPLCCGGGARGSDTLVNTSEGEWH